MIHENTFTNGCGCEQCNAKSYDFDKTLAEMQWRWDNVKMDNLSFLREFIALAQEIADNSDDSVEQVIGEFIINDKYDRED